MFALKGDNVVNNSTEMPWYEGEPLTSWLESIDVEADFPAQVTRLPVQSFVRPNLDFRGFTGTLEARSLTVGDEITVLLP